MERLPFSNIEGDVEFGGVVEIINENKPERLEKKKAGLAKKGIKTEPQPKYLHILKKVISVEWKLELFEPHNNKKESDLNVRSRKTNKDKEKPRSLHRTQREKTKQRTNNNGTYEERIHPRRSGKTNGEIHHNRNR